MNKAFDNFQWQNKPSTATPLGKTNLQKLNDAIDTIDDRVIALDSGKVSSVTVTNTLPTGDTIATITVDGIATNIKSAQITVDSEISTTSTNPVQNKVIAEALREVMPEVTVEGNPISITDGSNIVPAKLAEVTFLPKQDLHGYDNPWVGGAGKNKVPLVAMSSEKNGVTISTVYDSDNNIIGYKLNGTASAQTDFSIATGLGLEQGTNRVIYARQTEIAGLTGMITPSYDRTTTSRVLNKSISGYAIRIDSGTVLSNAIVNPMICDESSGSTFAPYENNCPISGRTQASVTRTGKNLFDFNSFKNTSQYIQRCSLVINSDGSVTATSTSTGACWIGWNGSGTLGSSVWVVEAKDKMCFSSGLNSLSWTIYELDKNRNRLYSSNTFADGVYTKHEQNSVYYAIRIGIFEATSTGQTKTFYPQIEYGESVTEFEPYQGETYTEPLGATYYGGKVDFVSGEGQNDYRNIDENSYSSVTASTSSGGLHWTDVVIGYTPTNIVCDRLTRKDGNSGWSSTTPCISYVESGGSKLLRIYCSESTISDFKTAYAGLQIVFSRETPATLTLTPQEIELLKGQNVLTTDGNSIKLVYSADIKAWVESQLSNS